MSYSLNRAPGSGVVPTSSSCMKAAQHVRARVGGGRGRERRPSARAHIAHSRAAVQMVTQPGAHHAVVGLQLLHERRKEPQVGVELAAVFLLHHQGKLQGLVVPGDANTGEHKHRVHEHLARGPGGGVGAGATHIHASMCSSLPLPGRPTHSSGPDTTQCSSTRPHATLCTRYGYWLPCQLSNWPSGDRRAPRDAVSRVVPNFMSRTRAGRSAWAGPPSFRTGGT